MRYLPLRAAVSTYFRRQIPGLAKVSFEDTTEPARGEADLFVEKGCSQPSDHTLRDARGIPPAT